MTRVLLAGGDPSVCAPLTRALTAEDYDVQVVKDGTEALDKAATGRFQVILLDMDLPSMDGLEVCRRLRVDGHAAPVVIFGTEGRQDLVPAVLESGGDDLLPKPFRIRELLARMTALLRRGGVDATVASGGLRMDVSARRAWVDGRELQLTAKEFELLRVLLREAGHVVSREDLLREVWGTDWWSSTKTLDMHMSWLRKKLGDSVANPQYIRTIRGVGFRFERA
jgi:DNA-binding response OmpR family regulator